MAQKINVENCESVVINAGGEGDCLFKCFATFFNLRSSFTVRQNIVSYVTEHWEQYKEEALHSLDINSLKAYKYHMGRKGVFGSMLECRAASNFYNINIIVVRTTVNSNYYILPFTKIDATKTLHLLFTGQHYETDRDGHFAILPQSNDVILMNNCYSEDQNQSTVLQAIQHETNECEAHMYST